MMLTQNVKVIEDVLNEDWKKNSGNFVGFWFWSVLSASGEILPITRLSILQMPQMSGTWHKKTGVSFTEVESGPVRVERF